jgi:dihydroorotase
MSETSTPFDLLIKGGTCVLPAGIMEADVGARAGRIEAIGVLKAAKAAETINAAGLHVLPGVIDTQVHFREPGSEQKEDFATGTAAAALGGVTAVFEMPNTSPATTTTAALADKCRRAKGRAWVDMAFYIGATAENIEKLGELEKLPGCCGVKLFMGSSTGDLLVAGDAAIAQVLVGGSRRMAVHAEDEERLKQRFHLAREAACVAAHPDWRDVETAVRATTRLLKLASGAGRRVHVLHVSTADEMTLLAKYRDIATVEVTPQHLTLAAPECYKKIGTRAQMNPPIRDASHRDALWAAVDSGLVDVIGSDHAPHTLAEKARPYPESPSGMPGVQTLVPVMLDHVNAGRLSLQRFSDLTCAGAARIFGIAGKGRIAEGYCADFTIVDLKARREITDMWIASRAGWTPFNGKTVTGWPIMTVLAGKVIMRDAQLVGEASGSALRFHECM